MQNSIASATGVIANENGSAADMRG